MTRAIVKAGVATALAAVLLASGFFLGRNSGETIVYDAPMSAAEAPLVGRWQIASNVEPKLSEIEFRRDRTATKYMSNEEVGMVANWGRIANQLTIQNAHVSGETGDYIPPAIFKVVKLDVNNAYLTTLDGEIEWKLSRL